MATYHPELQCDVLGIAYDFVTKLGIVHIEEGDCTDMTGCIDVFQRIDPRVMQIQTIAGGRDDTRYARRRGQWIAT